MHAVPEELIPHRPPMLMIDAVRSWTEDTVRAEKTFHPGEYGVENGTVLETVLIECIAQAAAAKESLDAAGENRPPSRGLLVGIEGFEVQAHVPVGATVEIVAVNHRKIGPFRLIRGEIIHGNVVAASGDIRIFLMDEAQDDQ